MKTEPGAPHLHVVFYAEQPADRSAVGDAVAVVVADERLDLRVGLGGWSAMDLGERGLGGGWACYECNLRQSLWPLMPVGLFDIGAGVRRIK